MLSQSLKLTARAANIVMLRPASQQLPYAHAKTGGWTQDAPTLHNPFDDDPLLEKVLRRWLPQQAYESVATDLHAFGERVVSELDVLGRECDVHPPQLEQHNAWGQRVDRLVLTPAWDKLKRIAAQEGLISIGYERAHGPWSRVHQIAKLYLFSPSAGLTTCPLAMTDGAAKTLEALSLTKTDGITSEAFERLTSRDPKRCWTSGQWMTEKKGGSDVGSGCDTLAVQQKDGSFRLHGYKWFSSATDADMALTLARIVDDQGSGVMGSKGLSLFLVRLRDAQTNTLNGIEIVRLKNKLGTKQVPTAELLLDGTLATKLSEPGRGVPSIANMLNITRIHNAVASVSGMRRILSLARDYAQKRTVFGRLQADWPLHLATMARMEVETRGCLLLLLESARLLGLQETTKAAESDLTLLRLITPLVKLYTAKQCMTVVSEGLECFGGQGYIEDTGLPGILRDAQVTPIWEGTTNVLSLDVLRVLAGTPKALAMFTERMRTLIGEATTDGDDSLDEARKAVINGLSEIGSTLKSAVDRPDAVRLDQGARVVAFALARVYAGALLVAHARDPQADAADNTAAYRFCCESRLVDLRPEYFRATHADADRAVVYDRYVQQKRSQL